MTDFKAFAAKAGLRASDADAAIDAMISGLASALDRLTLPAMDLIGGAGKQVAERMQAIVSERLSGFA